MSLTATPDLHAAWSEWLQTQPWDIFFTGTYRRPNRNGGISHAEYAFRAVLGRCSYAGAFVGEEYHRDRERIHIHGLIRTALGESIPADCREIWQKWFRAFGRAHAVPIRGKRDAVVSYCAKYVTKEMTRDYAIIGLRGPEI